LVPAKRRGAGKAHAPQEIQGGLVIGASQGASDAAQRGAACSAGAARRLNPHGFCGAREPRRQRPPLLLLLLLLLLEGSCLRRGALGPLTGAQLLLRRRPASPPRVRLARAPLLRGGQRLLGVLRAVAAEPARVHAVRLQPRARRCINQQLQGPRLDVLDARVARFACSSDCRGPALGAGAATAVRHRSAGTSGRVIS
jgi:hypothetical protein